MDDEAKKKKIVADVINNLPVSFLIKIQADLLINQMIRDMAITDPGFSTLLENKRAGITEKLTADALMKIFDEYMKRPPIKRDDFVQLCNFLNSSQNAANLASLAALVVHASTAIFHNWAKGEMEGMIRSIVRESTCVN